MKPDIRVYWPEPEPSSIGEVQYSREFCRRESMRLCSGLLSRASWIGYDPSAMPGHVLDHGESGCFLLVTDPLSVICPEVITQLHEAVKEGFDACGPVFNETHNDLQRANAPAAYYNMETFLQMAARVAAERKQKPLAAGRLDPACIMLKSGALPGLERAAAMAELEEFIQGRRAVAPGALVHRFARTYESERQDLAALIPSDAHRILDIGCASGGYGKTVKALRPDVYLAGVEINPGLAQKARTHYDLVHAGSVEDLEIPESGFDLINCGDVLEHLYDPWTELTRFYALLRPNGYLVTSIPNMGHWSVLLELLHGSFFYVPSGLQFVSHIRWFTRDSILRMLGEAGFAVEIMDAVKPELSLEGIEFIDKMIKSRHGDREMLETMAYNIRARRK